MKKLKPVVTEKSLSLAKTGSYTFLVDNNLTKNQIKKAINEVFGVNVVTVKTINLPEEIKKNHMGKKRRIKSKKKTIVTLKDKEKIDLFEEKGK